MPSSTEDAQQNKMWAILGYVLFVIPLILGPKNSRFARYHANQGLNLCIFWVALLIILSIVQAIVIAASYYSAIGFYYGYGAGLIVFNIVWLLYAVVMALFFLRGVLHAIRGEMEPLPIPFFGKLNILKVT